METKKQIEELKKHLNTLPDGIVKDTVQSSLAKLEASSEEEKVSSENDVAVQRVVDARPQLGNLKDAVCLVVHFILIEQGCKTSSGTDLPSDWANLASDRVFVFRYEHSRMPSEAQVVLKCLYLAETLQVHCASSKEPEKVYSLDLNVEDYMTCKSEDKVLSRKMFHNIHRLRDLVEKELIQPIVPRPPAQTSSGSTRIPLHHMHDDYQPFIPSVGRSDVLPAGIGGGFNGGGMEVGPDHPIFGATRPAFPGGPVPGARFDPFGPPGPVPFRPGRPNPAPRDPFSGPDPDHLRMPPDSSDPFGFGGANFF